MDIGDQQQKKSRLVPKWPSYVNFSVFLRWRVAAGHVGKWREGEWEARVKDLKLTGTCLWTLVTNSKKKSARLVPKWPSYVNSVFLRWGR